MAHAELIKTVGAGAVAVAIMVLQTFLCLRKNVLFSAILPVICFVFSVVFVLTGFSDASPVLTSDAVMKAVKAFFLLNIPTAVLTLYSLVLRKLRDKFNK